MIRSVTEMEMVVEGLFKNAPLRPLMYHKLLFTSDISTNITQY